MSKVTERVCKVFLLLRSEISNPKEVKIFPERELGFLRARARVCVCGTSVCLVRFCLLSTMRLWDFNLPYFWASSFLCYTKIRQVFWGKSPCFAESFSFQSFHQPCIINHQQGLMILLQPRIDSVWAKSDPQPMSKTVECFQRRKQPATVSSSTNSSSLTVWNFNLSNSCCFRGYLCFFKNMIFVIYSFCLFVFFVVVVSAGLLWPWPITSYLEVEILQI